MTKDEFAERVKAVSWETDISRILSELHISLSLNGVNGAVTFGQSKMGGVPDIQDPANAKMIEGNPMDFFAQINLSDVQRILPSPSFPSEGVVFFFAKNWQQKDNAYPVQSNDYAVFYEKQRTNNQATTGTRLSFSKVPTIPSLESSFYYSLSESDRDAYQTLFEEFIEKNDLTFSERLFGDCLPIQAYPDWGRNSFLKKNILTLSDQQSLEAKKISDSYILLLQCLYDEDGAQMYWGISKEDLALGRFENVVLDVQTS
jgi:uncharacterized protein YwqG